MTNAKAVRSQLETRMVDLAARVEHVEEELRAPVSASFAEQAIEREGEEVLADLEQAALSEIAAIRAALARIDDGRYGDCASCGQAIAPARLAAIPHAVLCIQCAGAKKRP
jgi:DnaK suppressor protein